MSTDPRFISFLAANTSMDALRDLFDVAGTSARPDGWALRAFRRALTALRGHLAETDYVLSVLEALRDEIERDAERSLVLAWDIGTTQARAELTAYGYTGARRVDSTALVAASLAGVMSVIDSQIARARALIVTKCADDARLLGEGSRVGVITPAPVLLELSDATVRAAVQAHQSTVIATAGRDRFQRQAIATIDERTTDCCLRVTGQIRGWDDEFQLAPGVPRFADRLLVPPFHWYCRTVQVLVPTGTGETDPLTLRIRAAAQAELDARARTGRRVEINPSFSFSGRGG